MAHRSYDLPTHMTGVTRPDIVFFGIDHWDDVYKRPRHLALHLSETHRVIYVNPCYYSAPGYIRDTLFGGRPRNYVWGVEQISPTLSVASFPPILPKGALYPVIGHLNYRLLLPLIRRTLRRLGVSRPVLWLSAPPDQSLIGRLDERLAIYDCTDRHSLFHEGAIRRQVEAEEQVMFRRADVVIASSTLLGDHCRQYHADVHVVQNGVEPDDFAARTVVDDPLPSIQTPIVGYTGHVGPWLDIELLEAICRTYPDVTLVLLGRVGTDLTALQRYSNVRILGERPYKEIPAYVGRFDVCLIPFVVNSLTQAVNPLKLYEYLAAGKPVVSTALPEIEPYADVTAIAGSISEFVACVGAALREARTPNPDEVSRRQHVALENSWQRRADQIDQIMQMVLH